MSSVFDFIYRESIETIRFGKVDRNVYVTLDALTSALRYLLASLFTIFVKRAGVKYRFTPTTRIIKSATMLPKIQAVIFSTFFIGSFVEREAPDDRRDIPL